MLGFVLSMLIPPTLAAALGLPALSTQVPDADCPAPSPLLTMGAVQLPIPDKLSVPPKLTVTSVLFQPYAFAAGSRDGVAVGAVLSIFTAAVGKTALLPALSVTVTLPLTNAPSAPNTSGLA